MKIKVIVSIGLVGRRREIEFDVDDDSTDDELEEIAKEAMFEVVQWHWERSEGKPAKRRGKATP